MNQDDIKPDDIKPGVYMYFLVDKNKEIQSLKELVKQKNEEIVELREMVKTAIPWMKRIDDLPGEEEWAKYDKWIERAEKYRSEK